MEPSNLSRRPAVRTVGLLLVGILLASIITLPSWLTYTLAFALTTLCLVAYLRSWGSLLCAIGLQLLIVLIGFHLTILQRQKIISEVLSPAIPDETVSIQGTLESAPVTKETRTELLLRTQTVTQRDTTSRIQRRVLVIVRRSARGGVTGQLEVGDLVRVHGTLERLPMPRNPGEFDYGRYLALNGVQGIVVVHDTSGLERISPENRPTFSSLVGQTQKVIYGALDRFHRPEQSSFLKGIVFGYRADISMDVKQSFIDTGTIHILAVSGSNVLVVALVIHSLFSFFRLSKRWVTIATIVGLTIYMVITGLSPSVIRATIMAGAVLLGTLFERKTDIYNSLAAAALVMLLWDPLYIFDVGFQLSFAAVLSIVYFYPKLELLIRRIPERFEEIKAIDYVLKLFAVSLAAQLGTLPFTAYYFGRISLVSMLANLVVVPISGINVMLGFATLAFSTVSTWIAQSYAALNGALVTFLLGFVSVAAKAPFAYADVSSVGATLPAFYYIGIAAVFSFSNRRALVKLLITGLVLLNIVVYADLLGSHQPGLTVTAIDVGQGDAVLLEFPNDKRVLVDAGPRSFTSDAGQRVIAPLLKRKGIQRLDVLILTHPHADHIGGAEYLLDHLQVGRILAPSGGRSSALHDTLLARANARGIPVRSMWAGDTLAVDPSARIYVLFPVEGRDSAYNLNNTSSVLRVVYGSTSLLLPGDAETEVEERLLQRYGPFLPSTVLKSPHHGSITGSSKEFLQAVKPAIVVISVGRNNKFGHPSVEVLDRYRELGVRVRRTDVEGAVILESDGSAWTSVDWRE